MKRRAMFSVAAIGAVAAMQLYEPPSKLLAGAPGNETARSAVAVVTADSSALGISGEVRMRFIRSGERVAFPLKFFGEPYGFRYQWVRVGSNEVGDVARDFIGDTLLSPLQPGFYELQLEKGGIVQRISEPRLAVLVPFELKLGSTLNGYRIGRYPSEWKSQHQQDSHPEGFVEVREADAELLLSRHLKVGDFISHDRQRVWPRYVAIDSRVLDKIELVLKEIARRRGEEDQDFRLQVHSGFRTPLHNAGVEGAARDSRHLYGDAADIAIDADGDGKLTIFDAYQVERAVDWVERVNPELIGGLGVYSSKQFSTPYCHIDARGERKRWRG